MAIKVHSSPTPLDKDLSAFLRRLGDYAEPLDSVLSYSVQRSPGHPTTVEVRLLADSQFDAPIGPS